MPASLRHGVGVEEGGSVERGPELLDAPSKSDSRTESAREKTAWSLRFVRDAIRGQRISFPSQVPPFRHLPRADILWRIVLLYFIRGWPTQKIASRYGITKERVMQLLRQWTSQAVILGYVDRIPSEIECVPLPRGRSG